MNSSVMELKIKLMGDERSVEVRADATVGELKQLLSELFREPPYKQRLSAENGSLISLDSRKLRDYGLQSGCLVILLINRPFQVFVKNEEDIIGTYDVYENETVDQLQTKIYNKESPKGSTETGLQRQTAGAWQEVARLQHHIKRHHLHDSPSPRRFIEEISTTRV